MLKLTSADSTMGPIPILKSHKDFTFKVQQLIFFSREHLKFHTACLSSLQLTACAMWPIPLWSRKRILLIGKFFECFIIHDSFRLGLISAIGISAWKFHHRNFLAWGHFGIGIFPHHGHFGTVAPAPKCLCRNVYIALHSAKMSQCRNIPVPWCP